MAEPNNQPVEVDWNVRAVALELLALSFRYPDSTLAEAVASGEWLDAARELAQTLDLELPEDFVAAQLAVDAEGNAAADASSLMHALRVEATRLFVGPKAPVVSPYEGIWRAADDGVEGLLFVNPHSMDVERYLKSCGLGRPQGTNEPLDHASTELEFMQYLSMLEAHMTEPSENGVQIDALPGGSASAAYGQFVEEHASKWLPRFAAAVEEKTTLPFYRAAAQLLGAVLKAC